MTPAAATAESHANKAQPHPSGEISTNIADDQLPSTRISLNSNNLGRSSREDLVARFASDTQDEPDGPLIKKFEFPGRVQSFPRRENCLPVTVKTTFKGEEREDEYDIPSKLSLNDSYKFIEGTAKAYFARHKDLLSNCELSLSSGFCDLSCGGRCCDPPFEPLQPEHQRLENTDHWADITSIIQNVEPNHKNLKITITRNLDLTTIPTTMADLKPKFTPTPERWLCTQLKKATKELPYKRSVSYIPYDTLQELTTKDIIRRVVKDASDIHLQEDFVARVCRTAPTLFALFIRQKIRLKLLEEALDNGTKDSSFPISQGARLASR